MTADASDLHSSGETSTLEVALAQARSGDFDAARRSAEAALAAGVDQGTYLAFSGMLEIRAGNLELAAEHLRSAYDIRPQDLVVACNLIAVLLALGRLAEARDFAHVASHVPDPTLRIARYRAFLALELEDYDEAARGYELVVDRFPDDFESWNNLGNARAALGMHEGSVEALQHAARLRPDVAPTRLNLAEAIVAAGDPLLAQAELVAAVEAFPKDAKLRFALFSAAKSAGNGAVALAALETAAALETHNAAYQLQLAVEYGLLARTAESEAAYERALVADPALEDAYLGLAVLFEHTNRAEEFDRLIARVAANKCAPGVLAFVRGLADYRAGRYEEAMGALDQVPARIEPQRTAHLRAQALERLGRSREAFAQFTVANAIHIADASDPLARASGYRDRLRREISLLTPQWVDDWNPATAPSDDHVDPVFLVGFPRSGTTLLDTFLMGHPRTVVMEEQPALNIVDGEIGGMAALSALDGRAIATARRRYFEEVDKVVHRKRGSVLVDKSPLYLHKLPLVARLFPDARFILALRHPCDVLLSCFMSNFRLNAAMSNFLRLADAAALYDLTFRHWESARKLFPAPVEIVRYEQLIGDPRATLVSLFRSLGLSWHEPLVEHRATAQARGLITTASYAQVTEPIYRRAEGRWLRYRSELAEVLPVLQPWIEKFGYEIADGEP